MALTQITEKGIKDGEIVNADINASAAIAKSKIETFVNNNADNRVITGSGTANTLNGESDVIIDSSGNVGIGLTDPDQKLEVSGVIAGNDLKIGRLGDRYPIIQRHTAPAGSQSMTITGGAGLSTFTGTEPTINDAVKGAAIKIGAGNPTSDVYGGGIKYIANGHTSPNNSGTGNQHVFYTRSAANTSTERMRIDSDGYLTKASGLTCAFNVKGGNMTRFNANAYVCAFDDDSSSGCFDSGNNFDTSTYKFTAPVSGYYYFFTNIRLDSFSTGYIRTAILSTSYNTNVTYRNFPSTGHVINYYQTPDNITVCQTSTVMYLPATHEAWVYQDPSADTSYTVYLSESSFGGYFIG